MEVKTGYKLTEVGVIPEEWETRRCSELSQRIMVGVVVRPTQYYVPQGVPAFRSANIREDGINNADLVFISALSNGVLAKSQTRTGDVLTVRTGYPGTSAVVREAQAGCNCIDILITRPSNKVDSDFLATWINSPLGKEQVLRNQGGLAQKHFNVSDMRNLVVAVPPVEEQCAVAAALTDADSLLAKLDQLIAKKRDLKQGAMQQLLTGRTRLPGFSENWQVRQLGALGSTYGGLTAKTKADFGSGDGQYITFMNVMTNVVIDCQIFDRVRVASTEPQNRVRRGDLIFNGSSETPEELAMCALMDEDVPNLFLNSFCFGFRFRDKAQVDGLFLAYYFRSAQGRNMMTSLAQGSTRYNLSKGLLLDALLPLPIKAEQEAIAAVLSDMDTELVALEGRRAKTRLLKQGMMQELLTGRVRLLH